MIDRGVLEFVSDHLGTAFVVGSLPERHDLLVQDVEFHAPEVELLLHVFQLFVLHRCDLHEHVGVALKREGVDVDVQALAARLELEIVEMLERYVRPLSGGVLHWSQSKRVCILSLAGGSFSIGAARTFLVDVPLESGLVRLLYQVILHDRSVTV